MIVAYIRTATAAQQDIHSQRVAIGNWEARTGQEVTLTYSDLGVSGITMPYEREPFEEARSKLHSGDTLLVTDYARIARNAHHLAMVLTELNDRDIHIELASGDTDD
jgi:DNA invertase Pin-like site-specific DNA recombinase